MKELAKLLARQGLRILRKSGQDTSYESFHNLLRESVNASDGSMRAISAWVLNPKSFPKNQTKSVRNQFLGKAILLLNSAYDLNGDMPVQVRNLLMETATIKPNSLRAMKAWEFNPNSWN